MIGSQIIRNAVEGILSKTHPVNLHSRDALLANLTFLYQTMKASENLLSVAAGYSEGKLRDYFVYHLFEEKGHADWLACDLATGGVDVSKIGISRHAVELVGSQYYLVQHVDPCMLLGYMVLMECFPMPIALVEELEQLHGRDLMRTARLHAENDVQHGEDLLLLIDSLEPRRQRLVLESAVQAAYYFSAATASFV